MRRRSLSDEAIFDADSTTASLVMCWGRKVLRQDDCLFPSDGRGEESRSPRSTTPKEHASSICTVPVAVMAKIRACSLVLLNKSPILIWKDGISSLRSEMPVAQLVGQCRQCMIGVLRQTGWELLNQGAHFRDPAVIIKP